MATGNDVKFRVSVDTGGAPQELNELGQAVDRVTRETDGMEASGRKAASATDKLGGSAEQAGALLKNLGATIAAGFTFQQLVDAAAQFESVKAGLQAVSGSAEAAGENMDFVRAVANRTGSDINEVGRAFLGLSAATKGTAVEGEPTRRVFEAVANAMSKAGKSSAETQNALVALSQIASKGTVSMEELRGQLGEALPGALQAAADGLGITTQDLIKLVEQGEIAAEDLFPALAQGLTNLYGNGTAGAQTLSQEITNIKNAFTELAADLGEAGGLDALKVGAEIAQSALVLLNDALVTTGKTIGTLAGAVATLDFSQLPEAFAEIERESREKLLKAAEYNQTLATYIGAVGNEATKAALATQQAGNATKVAGEAAAGAAVGFVSLGSAYNKVKAEIDQQIEASGKSRDAREAESKSSVELAKAFGTEAEQRAATVAAAKTSAEDLAKEAELRTTALNVAKAELAAKTALLEQAGGASEQRQKDLAELQKEVEARQAAADKAIAQAQSANVAAEAAKVEAQTHQDNSARLGELAKAYEAAKAKVNELTAAKQAGKAVDGELAAAQIAAGQAAVLYRDALADQKAMIEATTASKAADQRLAVAGLELEKQHYTSLEATARAIGDENLATYAKVEAKKIEIAIVQANTQAAIIEQQGKIAVARATLQELEATNQLTPVKKIELETQIKIAEAAILAAKARGQSVDVIKMEIDALQRGTSAKNANAAAANGAAGSVDNEALSRERNTEAIESETDALNRQIRAKKSGEVTGSMDQIPDFSSTAEADQWWEDQQKKRRESNSGMGESEWVRWAWDNAKAEFDATRSNLARKEIASAPAPAPQRSSGSLSRSDNSFYQNQLQQAVARGDTADAAEIRDILGGNLSPTASAAPTPVNITINGARQSLNVASPSDAATLQRILQQLANDSGRT